jgi:hypothetical protein
MIDWVIDDEDQARAMVKRLLDADGLGRWREMDHRKMSPRLGYGTRPTRLEWPDAIQPRSVPAMFPWTDVESRIRPNMPGLDRNGPGSVFAAHGGGSGCLWRVQDSNLSSFRDGFTEDRPSAKHSTSD